MRAFPAARRTTLGVLLFALVIAVPLTLAPAARADDAGSGYLGVMLQDISPSMAKALQLGDKTGVMINEVVPDSPADRVGLEEGDIILMFKGQATASYRALTEAVRDCKPGEKVEMVILHGGKKQTLQVELGEREDTFVWTGKGDEDREFRMQMLKDLHKDMEGDQEIIIKRFPGGDDESWTTLGEDRGFLGVHLDDVQDQLAEYFQVDGGALVTAVNEDSPAAEAGLKAGDVIVRIDDQDVDSAASLHQALAGTEAGQEVKVKVVRKGDDRTFEVTLGEAPEDMAFGNVRIMGDRGGWTMTAPKMLFHGKPGKMHALPHREDREVELFLENDDLDELRQELKQLKKELQELKKDLEK